MLHSGRQQFESSVLCAVCVSRPGLVGGELSGLCFVLHGLKATACRSRPAKGTVRVGRKRKTQLAVSPSHRLLCVPRLQPRRPSFYLLCLFIISWASLWCFFIFDHSRFPTHQARQRMWGVYRAIVDECGVGLGGIIIFIPSYLSDITRYMVYGI